MASTTRDRAEAPPETPGELTFTEEQPRRRLDLKQVPRSVWWAAGLALVVVVLIVSLAAWGPGMEFPTTVSTSEVATGSDSGGTIEVERTVRDATGTAIDDAVDWITVEGAGLFKGLATGVTHALINIERGLKWLPWPVVVCGLALVSFAVGDTDKLIEEAGEVPLPPYIRRRPNAEDAVRYQTVFARDHGAIAAPTAGLHFTSDLLGSIEAGGTAVASILLHVGPGTFEPIRSEELGQNSLEPEYYEVDRGTAAELCKRRRMGGRLVAVGTTVVRTLETVVGQNGEIRSGRGWSGKFIFPPYEFKAIDALLTNFHLPRSSLLLLIAAFAGRGLVIEAYRAAVAERYRFYSYGDAMLIL